MTATSTGRSEAEHGGRTGRAAGRGMAAQVALARRESPQRVSASGTGAVLGDEMPHPAASAPVGSPSGGRALARETACLSRADRAEVDRQVAGDLDALEAMGDGRSRRRTRPRL